MKGALVLMVLASCSTPRAQPGKAPVMPKNLDWHELSKGSWWQIQKACPTGMAPRDQWVDVYRESEDLLQSSAVLMKSRVIRCTSSKTSSTRLPLPKGLGVSHELFRVLATPHAMKASIGFSHGQVSIIHDQERIDFLMFDGTLHGAYRHTHKAGLSIRGSFFGGKPHGRFVVKDTVSGEPSEWIGVFDHGRLSSASRNGVSELSQDGTYEARFGAQTISGYVEDGRPVGRWTIKYADLPGSQHSTTLKILRADRVITQDHVRGTRTENRYENWLREGVSEVYEGGALTRRTRWRKGRLVEIMEYSGRLDSRAEVFHGVLHGTYQTYWPSGRRQSLGNYRNGLPDGRFTYFDRQGRQVESHHLVKGTGKLRTFNDWPMEERAFDQLAQVDQGIVSVRNRGRGYCDNVLVQGATKSTVCNFTVGIRRHFLQGYYGNSNKASGNWRYESSGGPAPSTRASIPYENGRLHGLVTIEVDRRHDPMVVTVSFAKDKLHGPRTAKVAGRIIEEINYSNGLLDGRWLRRVGSKEDLREYSQNQATGIWTISDGTDILESCEAKPGSLSCTEFQDGSPSAVGVYVFRPLYNCDRWGRKSRSSDSDWCAHGIWTKLDKKGAITSIKKYEYGRAIHDPTP